MSIETVGSGGPHGSSGRGTSAKLGGDEEGKGWVAVTAHLDTYAL